MNRDAQSMVMKKTAFAMVRRMRVGHGRSCGANGAAMKKVVP
jgi:hypothetical protein